MIRWSNLIWFVLVMVAGATLFTISYSVKEREASLRKINKTIAQHDERLRVLRAEWSYLNQPNRLEQLAKQFTALKPTHHQQMVAVDTLPFAMADNSIMPVTQQNNTPAMPKPILASLGGDHKTNE